MGDEAETDPDDPGDIVSEDVRHQDVGVLAVRHVHRTRKVSNHIEV